MLQMPLRARNAGVAQAAGCVGAQTWRASGEGDQAPLFSTSVGSKYLELTGEGV